MRACTLDENAISRLAIGTLSSDEAVQLLAHVRAGACARCDRMLEDSGFDEETLALMVASVETPTSPERDRIDRIWRRVNAKWATPEPALRTMWKRWHWGFAGGLVAVAATVLAVVSMPPGAVRSTEPTEKGALALPRATLLLERSRMGPIVEDETIELRYSLDRDAYVTVVHEGPDQILEFLHRGRAASSGGRGTFRVANGVLGYRFDGERGKHLFAMIVGDRVVDDDDVRRLVDAQWLEAPTIEGDYRDLGVRVHGFTIDVESRP